MKKLIAISVMCALVAGAAFADTTFGGQIFVGGNFLNGDNVEGSHFQTKAIGYDNYNTLVKITFGDSTAGGWMGLHNNNGTYYHGFAWWRPIPQLRFQIGRNQDGDWGGAQISGWGFTGEAKNVGGSLAALGEYEGGAFGSGGRDHARTVGWYPGVSAWAFNTSIYPIEGLSINLSIPFSNSEAIAFTYSRIEANIQYRLTDIGTAALSFQSNTGYIEGDKDAWYGENGQTDASASPKIYASFFLTAIENMAIDIGLAYKFPFNNTAEKTKTYHPFEIGLGYRYNIGDFQLKLRTSISVAGSTDVEGKDPVKDATRVSINILPNYKIGSVTVYFYAGLGIQANDYKEDDESIWAANQSGAVVNWFVNPYVMIPVGGMRFFTGFQIYSDGKKYVFWDGRRDNAKIDFAIPFGFYTYF